MKTIALLMVFVLGGCIDTSRDLALAARVADEVAARIKNVSDNARWGRDVWQPPEYTKAFGGDCEDHVIVAMTILNDQGIASYMVIGSTAEWDHAWLRVHGVDFDPTLGGAVADKRIVYIERRVLGFSAVMSRVEWGL